MGKPRLVLIQDSREQAGLLDEFKKGVFDEIVTRGLPYGDYACEIEGKAVPIVFERKGLGDLFGTLTSGSKRFRRVIQKANKAGCQFVLLVEGTLRDVAGGYEHSSVAGDTIIKTVFSNWVRHGLTPVFCPDRRTMARVIEETYTAVARNCKSPTSP